MKRNKKSFEDLSLDTVFHISQYLETGKELIKLFKVVRGFFEYMKSCGVKTYQTFTLSRIPPEKDHMYPFIQRIEMNVKDFKIKGSFNDLMMDSFLRRFSNIRNLHVDIKYWSSNTFDLSPCDEILNVKIHYPLSKSAPTVDFSKCLKLEELEMIGERYPECNRFPYLVQVRGFPSSIKRLNLRNCSIFFQGKATPHYSDIFYKLKNVEVFSMTDLNLVLIPFISISKESFPKLRDFNISSCLDERSLRKKHRRTADYHFFRWWWSYFDDEEEYDSNPFVRNIELDNLSFNNKRNMYSYTPIELDWETVKVREDMRYYGSRFREVQKMFNQRSISTVKILVIGSILIQEDLAMKIQDENNTVHFKISNMNRLEIFEIANFVFNGSRKISENERVEKTNIEISNCRNLKSVHYSDLTDRDRVETIFTFQNTPELERIFSGYDLNVTLQFLENVSDFTLQLNGPKLPIIKPDRKKITKLVLWYCDRDVFQEENRVFDVQKNFPNLKHLEIQSCKRREKWRKPGEFSEGEFYVEKFVNCENLEEFSMVYKLRREEVINKITELGVRDFSGLSENIRGSLTLVRFLEDLSWSNQGKERRSKRKMEEFFSREEMIRRLKHLCKSFGREILHE